MDSVVKKETVGAELPVLPATGPAPPYTSLSVIDISSSDDSSDDEEGPCMAPNKKPRFLGGGVASGGPLKMGKSKDKAGVVLPVGFLDPLPMEEVGQPPLPLSMPQPISVAPPLVPVVKGCRQFWKAGDYDGGAVVEPRCLSAGIDHVRVHPKFLHSNATSHKWALGAVAELLDNAVDEVCNGATFVNVDVLENRKNATKMLLVEDNGGGMDPTKLRQCMSLGYSVKSKSTNTIGQYGNGFKTSTMRLGADVIVFSRCRGKGGKSSTQSIGMLSYTFLRDTGKEDIIVPMLDYEKREEHWNRLVRSSFVDWNKNLETILQWSPYASKEDLLEQFATIEDQGTRIVIYNLWDDDQGELELEFNADAYDIQVRGASRDEKKIQMAKKFPNSKHFLTYRHSLRSYASILYLRLPQDFKMILRGREIEHHNIANDMMTKQEHTYKPQYACDGVPRDPNMVAVVTIGFVKDAKEHIDVQGFNVYHKNRLIKPFWRVWNASGSGGRGVIGVLEANFVEPAHDKQDFERTTVLARLEARLAHMQKTYWGKNSYLVGYCERTTYKKSTNGHNEASSPSLSKAAVKPVGFTRTKNGRCENGLINAPKENGSNSAKGFGERSKGNASSDSSDSSSSDSSAKRGRMASLSHLKETVTICKGSERKSPSSDMLSCELQRENLELKDRLKKMEDQKKSLIEKLEETEKLLEEAHKEQEALVDIFSEERDRRDMEEENLRKKLKDACATIEQLRDKLT